MLFGCSPLCLVLSSRKVAERLSYLSVRVEKGGDTTDLSKMATRLEASQQALYQVLEGREGKRKVGSRGVA